MLPCSPQPDSQTQAAVKHANVSAHHYPEREGEEVVESESRGGGWGYGESERVSWRNEKRLNSLFSGAHSLREEEGEGPPVEWHLQVHVPPQPTRAADYPCMSVEKV